MLPVEGLPLLLGSASPNKFTKAVAVAAPAPHGRDHPRSVSKCGFRGTADTALPGTTLGMWVQEGSDGFAGSRMWL